MQLYQEHIVLLTLQDWETVAFNALRDKIIEDAPLMTLINAGKVCLLFSFISHDLAWWGGGPI
jgi:hypothetical protein